MVGLRQILERVVTLEYVPKGVYHMEEDWFVEGIYFTKMTNGEGVQRIVATNVPLRTRGGSKLEVKEELLSRKYSEID